MDLTVLIVIIVSGFIIYNLINTIRSLTEEIREIKAKCIRDDFSMKTKDPVESFKTNLVDNIKYFQRFFDDNDISKKRI